MRKVDANHDGTIAVNEFMTTLIDWNQMQALGEWQVWGKHANHCLPPINDHAS
jgi:calcium-dependent protein kinase